MGFGEALYKRQKDGGPWVPPWWFSFIVLPLMVVAEFYVSQRTGWGGLVFPNTEGVPWSEVTSDGIVSFVVPFLIFYYVLVLPIFLVRRSLWEKGRKEKAIRPILHRTFSLGNR